MAHYLRSHWHQYIEHPRVWISGIAAVLPVSLIPLPFGRVIARFGGGAVYMSVLDEKVARLEAARVR